MKEIVRLNLSKHHTYTIHALFLLPPPIYGHISREIFNITALIIKTKMSTNPDKAVQGTATASENQTPRSTPYSSNKASTSSKYQSFGSSLETNIDDGTDENPEYNDEKDRIDSSNVDTRAAPSLLFLDTLRSVALSPKASLESLALSANTWLQDHDVKDDDDTSPNKEVKKNAVHFDSDVDKAISTLAETLLDDNARTTLEVANQADATSSSSYLRKLAVLKHAATSSMADRQHRPRWEPIGTPQIEDRETWSNDVEFALTSIQAAVGFGNVMYLKDHVTHGGIVFFIPYIFFLLVFGMPALLVEMAQGQFTSLGPTTCWDFARLFQGLGFSMIVANVFSTIHYIIRVAISLKYMFYQLPKDSPWLFCRDSEKHELHEWNTKNCKDYEELKAFVKSTRNHSSSLAFINITPAFEFYERSVKKKDYSLGTFELGEVNGSTVLFLFLAWGFVYIRSVINIKYAGKFSYVIGLAMTALSLILLTRVSTLDGASDGIQHFMTPHWEKLVGLDAWTTAAQDIYYTLTLSVGVHTCLASFNRFKRDFFQTIVLMPIVNLSASIVLALIQMSIFGAFAKESRVAVTTVVEEVFGPAAPPFTADQYIFISLTYMFQVVPDVRYWYGIWYFILCSLGIGIVYAQFKTAMVGIGDFLPPSIPAQQRWAIFGGMCVVCFLLGIFMCQSGDVYNFSAIIDFYSTYMIAPIIFALQLISLTYTYGTERFLSDLRCMLGDEVFFKLIPFSKFQQWFLCTFKYLTPGTLVFLLIVFGAEYSSPSKNNAVIALGNVIRAMTLLPVIVVPAVYLIRDRRQGGSVKQRLQTLITPTEEWGPLREADRIESGYKITPAQLMRNQESSTPKPAVRRFTSVLQTRSSLIKSSSSPRSISPHKDN